MSRKRKCASEWAQTETREARHETRNTRRDTCAWALPLSLANARRYSSEENDMIRRVTAALGGRNPLFCAVLSPDRFVKVEQSLDKSTSPTIFRGTAVADASIEECAAWESLKTSRERNMRDTAAAGEYRSSERVKPARKQRVLSRGP